MVDLFGIVSLDRIRPMPQDISGDAVRLSASRFARRYQRELRHPDVSLSIHSDSPIEAFLFQSPEVSLICRCDLLRDHADDLPAAHLAALYLQQGDEFVKALRGTFAIVLYDHRHGALKAWVDHFGAQKLLYAKLQESIAVSTDLRVLVDVARKRPEVDLDVIPQYLQFTCIPTPKTIYKDFFKLPPGYQLTAGGRFTVHSYWDMSYHEATGGQSEEIWAEKTEKAIRSAVARAVAGDIQKIGCFMSGGTDSSSVAGLTGQLTGRAPRTFSIGFDDPRYNEIQYARIAAKRFGADHHEYFVTPGDILALAQKAAVKFDEPFGNSSIVPTYYCARLAAERGMSHLLAGDGGDELFGGNSRYAADKIFQRYGEIPAWARQLMVEPTVRLGAAWIGNGFFDRASSYIRRSSIPAPDRYFSYGLVSSVPGHELFTPEFLRSLNGDHSLEPARRHFHAAPASTELNRWLYLDLKIIITDNDLRKVTTMCELAGVHARYPLLDPTLAEFSGTIPTDLKVRGNQLRYLFKKAMKDVLPPEIITKTKHGFGLPYSVWLADNKPLRDFTFDVLGADRCRQRGYFRRDLPEWLWSQYETVHQGYYGDLLWVFLMLELWHLTQGDRSSAEQPNLMPASQIR
jgi:asparagine synthase (glutamine-hydrolysing)